MSTTRPAASVLAAYVLHRYDWSETSLILDVFTREQGRLAVAAKGAKRPYSQLRPVLMPFQRIHLSLGRVPKGEDPLMDSTASASRDIRTLRSADWGGSAALLSGAALFSGFYLNELLMKLLARQDPHPGLFDAYAQTLPVLASADDLTLQSALRAFEVLLIQQIGLLPELSRVTLTLEAVRPDGLYALLPEAGVAPVRAREPAIAGSALIAVQAALLHGSLPALQQACAMALPEWKVLLRGLLHYHLGGWSLRTRQVMQDLQTLAPTPP